MASPASIVELRCRSRGGIYAVPYRRRRAGRIERLPDGSIVELPTPEQRREAPVWPAPCLELALGGGPATIHHVYLGLVGELLAFEGVFVLPSGDVAAVYGADAIRLSATARAEGMDALD